jgi:hypothetical protein
MEQSSIPRAQKAKTSAIKTGKMKGYWERRAPGKFKGGERGERKRNLKWMHATYSVIQVRSETLLPTLFSMTAVCFSSLKVPVFECVCL